MKIIIYVLMLSFIMMGCRSKKSIVEKQSESISSIVHNDIKKSESEIETKTKVIKAESEDFNIKSINPEKPSYYSKKGDSIHFQNADILFSDTSSESREQTKKDSKKDESDSSKAKSNSSKSTKNKNLDITSPSWGVNIAIIIGVIILIVLAYIHYRTRSAKV